MKQPRAHAVVVAYHSQDALDRCLEGLGGTVSVVVVDNSSSSGVQAVASSHGATYVDPGANRGFAAGVNLGIEHVPQERHVLLVNPDAIVTPEVVELLLSSLGAHTCAVAPRLVGPDGAEQRVRWPFPTPQRAILEALGVGRLPSRSSFVSGAVVLLRREALDEVGPFDERFFLYAEEADWQRRALGYGWTSALCVGATARHIGGVTSPDSYRREALFHAGQETYIRKWFGATGWLMFRAAVFAGAALRAIVLPRRRRAEARRRAMLYLRGPRRCVTHGTD